MKRVTPLGCEASALAVLLQLSQKYLPRESVVARRGKPESTSASPFHRVSCVGGSSWASCATPCEISALPRVGCGCVVFTAELPWCGSTAQRELIGKPGLPTPHKAKCARWSVLAGPGREPAHRCRGVQSSLWSTSDIHTSLGHRAGPSMDVLVLGREKMREKC